MIMASRSDIALPLDTLLPESALNGSRDHQQSFSKNKPIAPSPKTRSPAGDKSGAPQQAK
jgi:hypothetical protein